MKKLFIALIALAFVAGYSTISLAGNATGISGSTHDFSTAAWNTSSDQICNVCHTPHDATSGLQPLWDHQVSTATYTAYGTTLAGTSISSIDGVSLLCLSCHDGTIALANYGGVTSGTTTIASTANKGTDLSDDHPVSVTYDETLAGMNTSTTSFGGGGTIATYLDSGKVQCSTCHDVHDSTGEAVASTPLLRNTLASSGLCLVCHDK